jgi:hypothetical protein
MLTPLTMQPFMSRCDEQTFRAIASIAILQAKAMR